MSRRARRPATDAGFVSGNMLRTLGTVSVRAVLLLFLPSILSSQEPKTRTLTGSVMDSVSGTPVQKAWVCIRLPLKPSVSLSRCSRVDTLGEYVLDSLPLDPIEVTLTCESLRALGKLLAIDTISAVASAAPRHDWVVSTSGCDPRPVRRVVGIFRGHYTPGFESSEFVPCPSDAWFLPGDSLDIYPFDARRAWATWPRHYRTDIQVRWPDAPRDAWGNPRYFIRWRGTVVGPGRYGHLGVSLFEFRVDSILEVRIPAQGDCE